MELIDLIPNSMSFRFVSMLDIDEVSEIPDGFTGRVRRCANGTFVVVAWYHRGVLHNPGRTHPAYRCYRRDGQVKYEHFYTNGVLHDPVDSMPAVRGFYASGSAHYEEHYRTGVRSDGLDGSAAVSKWRENGTLRHQIRYVDGRRVGSAAGSAA